MNFVEQWLHDDPDGRHTLIPCPHLALSDSWIDSGTRFINLIDNAVDGATTLALCGVCANTVVGALVDDVVQRTVNKLWSMPTQVTYGELVNGKIVEVPFRPEAPIKGDSGILGDAAANTK